MSILSVTCWGEDRSFRFEPAKTALLVIDMQRHFLEDVPGEPNDEPAATEAAFADQLDQQGDDRDEAEEIGDMRDIIDRVAGLLDFARKLGCTVVHTREGYSPDLSDVSDFRRELDYVGHDSPLGRTLVRGEPGHDFVAELRPLPGEAIIDKASFGAFFKTDLDARLTATGVTHLILCGVTTQCCVHSTLREAVDLGYWCLTVADCCAAVDPALHEAAMLIISGEGHLFGWIAELADMEASAINAPGAPTS